MQPTDYSARGISTQKNKKIQHFAAITDTAFPQIKIFWLHDIAHSKRHRHTQKRITTISINPRFDTCQKYRTLSKIVQELINSPIRQSELTRNSYFGEAESGFRLKSEAALQVRTVR